MTEKPRSIVNAENIPMPWRLQPTWPAPRHARDRDKLEHAQREKKTKRKWQHEGKETVFNESVPIAFLFGAEGEDGIDGGSSAGGQVTGKKGHGKKQ